MRRCSQGLSRQNGNLNGNSKCRMAASGWHPAHYDQKICPLQSTNDIYFHIFSVSSMEKTVRDWRIRGRSFCFRANKGTVLLFPSPCLYFRNERTVPMFISKQKDRPRAYPCLFLLITSTMIILYISIFPIEFMFCSAILQNPIDWNM